MVNRSWDGEPIPGFPEFEQHVMASDAPAVVLVDRALLRALLSYVHRLEQDVVDLLGPDEVALEILKDAVATGAVTLQRRTHDP